MQVIRYIKSSYYELRNWFVPKRFVIGTLVFLISQVFTFCQMPEYPTINDFTHRLHAVAFYFGYDSGFLMFFLDKRKYTSNIYYKRIARAGSILTSILVVFDITLLFVSSYQFNEFCHSQIIGLILSTIVLGIVFWNIYKLKQ